jgi:hypothetical protein
MMKSGIVGLLLLVLAAMAQCQLVEVGPRDPHYCEKLKVDPNLIVKQDANVLGRLIDGSGEPFRNSRVELRLFISAIQQLNVESVTTDADGHFEFTTVKAGNYRLIASPTRVFQQPAHLRCHDKRCEFAITLQVNPTDMPDSQCPVR